MRVDGRSVTTSLHDVVAAPETFRAIADTDPLVTAALWRLMLAIDAAARADAARNTATWLADHADDFELFHPRKPFGQNPDMARFLDLPGHAQPAATAGIFTAGRPMLFDLTHAMRSDPLDGPAAARLLLTRGWLSVGGIQQWKHTAYGKAAAQAQAAVGIRRPLLLIHGHTVADTLLYNRIPTVPGDRAYWTWPTGHTPGTDHPITGPLAGLTWPSRSMLLPPDPDGRVSSLLLCDGLRPAGAGPAHFLHTTWERDKTGTAQPRPVHLARPVWIQILQALLDPAATGSLDALRATEPTDRPAGRIHLTGLASYQSRVDGVVNGSIAIPRIPNEQLRPLLAAVSDVMRDTLRSAAQAYGTRTRSIDTAGDRTRPQVTAAAAAAIDQTLTGDLSVTEFTAALRRAANESLDFVRDDLMAKRLYRGAALITADPPPAKTTPRTRKAARP